MARKIILNKLSIYIPQTKQDEKLVERLIKLSDKKDRSANYLAVEAILEYLNREEKKWRKLYTKPTPLVLSTPLRLWSQQRPSEKLKILLLSLSALFPHIPHRVIPHFRAMGPGADPLGITL
jgi:hypothetical protein